MTGAQKEEQGRKTTAQQGNSKKRKGRAGHFTRTASSAVNQTAAREQRLGDSEQTSLSQLSGSARAKKTEGSRREASASLQVRAPAEEDASTVREVWRLEQEGRRLAFEIKKSRKTTNRGGDCDGSKGSPKTGSE
jgi:hypothetical protein